MSAKANKERIFMNIIIKPQGTTAIYEQIINQLKNAKIESN